MNLETLQQRISPNVRVNVPLAPFTTFRIGGPAEFFLEARTAEEALRAVTFCRETGFPYVVLGGGSNMLISDDGVKGLVVLVANRGLKIEGSDVFVEAGTPTGFVATKSVEAGLTGFEWAAGLPGTIGGAIRGNAGMFGGEMKDSVVSVTAIVAGVEQRLNTIECAFGYRGSHFRHHPGEIILSAVLRLRPAADPAASKALLRENILKKAKSQPIDQFTAGCAFMNWNPTDPAKEFPILRKSLDLDKEEVIPVTPTGGIPAGWIIDRAQLKGMKVGHASVSTKHANFIVSDGQATASEVIALTAAIKMKVRDMTHGVVELMDEIEYVGF